jgi:uncharacterized circularly permuted ATP-grasp superfamily protein/uncharacterized alpha-E superfamily protein
MFGPVNDTSSYPLLDACAPETPRHLADSLAAPATEGHYDELRGTVSSGVRDGAGLAPAWDQFFGHLGAAGFRDLNRRIASVRRQVRDNGVTYNVYADDDSGPQRPWSLDLFPLIVPPESWRRIEAGVLQRVRVLDRVMADVYGDQTLLRSGLLPAALVQGHPGYLRPMHGVQPCGGTFLHIAAFDLARGPDGHWWVVSQRTQAPSGLGYLLENRLSISRQFPRAFETMQVQRLAATYRALVEGLKRMSPAGAGARIALLTPGPYNETYFEHAYLARYLGLPLVEGSDLMVRDRHLYLRTLQGLQPVHGLLKRLDDEFLDPLELRADSTLGVPGLLQAIRAGNLLVANVPGSAFLESPALLGFLPALARQLLGEELQLPAVPTWWCGEEAALADALPQLDQCVVKATYPTAFGARGTRPGIHSSFQTALGGSLSESERDAWAARIRSSADDYTLQTEMPLSQTPTWREVDGTDRILPRPAILRVFAVADGPRSWRVLPGGLARVAGAGDGDEIASMQRGGSSADVWVLAPGAVDATTLLRTGTAQAAEVAALALRRRTVTSRSAENLFWLGRYTERAENTVRLARLALQSLGGDDQSSLPLLAWITEMCIGNALVPAETPPAAQARRVFERTLIDALGQPGAGSALSNLGALRRAAASVRERMAQEHWNTIVHAEEDFARRAAQHAAEGSYPAADALRLLDAASSHLAAITGGQIDRMTRDDGWMLLSIGRLIERLAFLSPAMALGFETGAVRDEAGFEGILALFDSTITFRAQYQQSRDIPALLELLAIDRDNPRSLAWVAHTLRRRLARLAGHNRDDATPETALPLGLPEALAPDRWTLEGLCDTALQPAAGAGGDGTGGSAIVALLQDGADAAYALSDAIGARYFTHADSVGTSIGL